MRIIAGTARGRRIFSVSKNLPVKPISDRIKQSLFDILRPRITGAIMLDLFAGTGSLGLEALSRGAKRCYFCDNSRQSLDLVKKNLVTSKMVLTIGYDIENLLNPEINKSYLGEVTLDHYGRKVPKSAHGTINIDHKTSSTKIITDYVMNLYESIINKNLLVRRINITAENVVNEDDYKNNEKFEQIDLFIDYNEIERQQKKEKSEKELQKAVLDIKTKYGKNAVLKGMNLIEGGTTIERNGQIGGHKS